MDNRFDADLTHLLLVLILFKISTGVVSVLWALVGVVCFVIVAGGVYNRILELREFKRSVDKNTKITLENIRKFRQEMP